MDAMPDKRGGPPLQRGTMDLAGSSTVVTRTPPRSPRRRSCWVFPRILPTTLRSAGSCLGLSGWGAAGASASSGFAQPCTGLKSALGMMTTNAKPDGGPLGRPPQRAGVTS
jgi:hypothetical protein